MEIIWLVILGSCVGFRIRTTTPDIKNYVCYQPLSTNRPLKLLMPGKDCKTIDIMFGVFFDVCHYITVLFIRFKNYSQNYFIDITNIGCMEIIITRYFFHWFIFIENVSFLSHHK